MKLRQAREDELENRYQRRGDCLALAVELYAGRGQDVGVEDVLQAADDFEDWMMQPFQEVSDAQDDAD